MPDSPLQPSDSNMDTDLPDKCAGQLALKRHIAQAKATDGQVGIALVEVNHFDALQTAYGAGVGRELVTEVARRLRANLRQSDSLSYRGDGGFLVVFPDAAFASFGERLRHAACCAPVATMSGTIGFTVSIGLASISGEAAPGPLESDAQAALERERAKAAAINGDSGPSFSTLSICTHCKRVKGTEGNWDDIERYVTSATGAIFSHGFCPTCLDQLYPE